MGYFLTQLISGHGYFKNFLFKIGQASTADCVFCPGARDEAEHMLNECDKWAVQRRSLAEVVGQQRPNNVDRCYKDNRYGQHKRDMLK